MSDLKHKTKDELKVIRLALIRDIRKLSQKVSGMKERLKWVDQYLEGKGSDPVITKEELRDLRDTSEIFNREFYQKLKAYALQECPYQIGDQVTILGKTHNGKTMVINQITANTALPDRVPEAEETQTPETQA